MLQGWLFNFENNIKIVLILSFIRKESCGSKTIQVL